MLSGGKPVTKKSKDETGREDTEKTTEMTYPKRPAQRFKAPARWFLVIKANLNIPCKTRFAY